MSRFGRLIPALLTTTLMGVLVAAAYFSLAPSPGPALHAQTDIEVTRAAAGEKREIAIALENRSGDPMRVLGWSIC